MKKRYSFIYGDRNDQRNGNLKRSKKKLLYLYKKAITTNEDDLLNSEVRI